MALYNLLLLRNAQSVITPLLLTSRNFRSLLLFKKVLSLLIVFKISLFCSHKTVYSDKLLNCEFFQPKCTKRPSLRTRESYLQKYTTTFIRFWIFKVLLKAVLPPTTAKVVISYARIYFLAKKRQAKNGCGDWIWTSDLQLMRLTSWPSCSTPRYWIYNLIITLKPCFVKLKREIVPKYKNYFSLKVIINP